MADLSSEHRDGRSWEVSRRSRKLPLTDSGIQCGPAKDGRILGGDAFFYCLGSYSSGDGRWKGEMLNQEHTPAKGETPCSAAMRSASDFPEPAPPIAASSNASHCRQTQLAAGSLAQADAKGVGRLLRSGTSA